MPESSNILIDKNVLHNNKITKQTLLIGAVIISLNQIWKSGMSVSYGAFSSLKQLKPFSVHLFRLGSPRAHPSRGGDVAGYFPDINQTSLPSPSYSVLVSVSAFMALSTVFHSINFPNNSIRFLTLFFRSFSALLVLSTIYLFMKVSVSPDVIYCG